MHKDSFFGRLIPSFWLYSDHTNYKRQLDVIVSVWIRIYGKLTL